MIKKFQNFLNYSFVNLANYVDQKHSIPKCQPPQRETFAYYEVKVGCMLSKTRELNANKPLGPRTVPACALKDATHIIAPHLNFIFNKFVKSNKFPDLLKRANVLPPFLRKMID